MVLTVALSLRHDFRRQPINYFALYDQTTLFIIAVIAAFCNFLLQKVRLKKNRDTSWFNKH